MKHFRKSYYNNEWYDYSNKIKRRDNYRCLKCGRGESIAILQTHHKMYKPRLKPWEYPTSDCVTLCKGCHAKEHGLVEPDSGWTLVSIADLGGLDGICERKGCGTEIRYEHITYHPKWGYKSVGSTCVEHLTREDQFLSREVLKVFKNISGFVNESVWESGVTKNGKDFLYTTFSHHQIRIYGKGSYLTFQVALKRKGERWFDFGDFIQARNKTLDQVKELGFIVLKGLITTDETEKELLRNIYSRVR